VPQAAERTKTEAAVKAQKMAAIELLLRNEVATKARGQADTKPAYVLANVGSRNLPGWCASRPVRRWV
jgi:hypothetical protein